MSDQRAFQNKVVEDATKAAVAVILRNIELRKWCVEKAVAIDSAPDKVGAVAQQFFDFITADVPNGEPDGEI